jgi:thymidine kinase
MFLENKSNGQPPKGWIEVIVGSMFSGKTEELIRRMKRALIAKQKVEIFKPLIDTRYSETSIVSHDANQIPSMPVANSLKILEFVNDAEVIGIDEAQFFDAELINVCNELANKGKRIIVAGLDMDFLGKPFGPMPGLLATAEYVTKVHAICMRCGDLASYSHRLSKNTELVELGEKDKYEPLCRLCYNEINSKK